jgi:hypothetical protein
VNPNPSEPPSDELLEQLKSQLPASLFATVSKKFLALQYAELKIQVLEERLRLRRIEIYGPGSEKLTNEQLELLELEPGVSTAEVQAESAREPWPGNPRRKEFAVIRAGVDTPVGCRRLAVDGRENEENYTCSRDSSRLGGTATPRRFSRHEYLRIIKRRATCKFRS